MPVSHGKESPANVLAQEGGGIRTIRRPRRRPYERRHPAAYECEVATDIFNVR